VRTIEVGEERESERERRGGGGGEKEGSRGRKVKGHQRVCVSIKRERGGGAFQNVEARENKGNPKTSTLNPQLSAQMV